MTIEEGNRILLKRASKDKIVPIYDTSGEIMTYDNGKILPAEWYDGEATQDAIDLIESQTSEQTYEDSLRVGLPRSSEWEKRLDLSKIDSILLE